MLTREMMGFKVQETRRAALSWEPPEASTPAGTRHWAAHPESFL